MEPATQDQANLTRGPDRMDTLRAHIYLFLDAYNCARRLKTLRGLTPYEFICQVWTKEPERFRLDTSHHIPGSYT